MTSLPRGFDADVPEEARNPMRLPVLPILPEAVPDEPVAAPTAPEPVAAPTRKVEPFAALNALKRRSTR